MMNLQAWWFGLTAQASRMGQGGRGGEWSGWPFGQGGFWPSVARLAFMAALLGGIALLLRLLFGAHGPLREKGLETMQEAKARRAAEDEAAARDAEAGGEAAQAPERSHDV